MYILNIFFENLFFQFFYDSYIHPKYLIILSVFDGIDEILINGTESADSNDKHIILFLDKKTN